MNKVYNLEDFPELNEFLSSHFNLEKRINADTVKINDSGDLIKHVDEHMFLSYDVGDYVTNQSKDNVFYQDFNRSDKEHKSRTKPIPYDKLKKMKTYCAYSQTPPKNNQVFEEYLDQTLHFVDKKYRSNENEKLIFRFLKIIYDDPNRTDPETSAICINQMFRKELSSSMVWYDNTKKMKSTLQKFRQHFSLLAGQHASNRR